MEIGLAVGTDGPAIRTVHTKTWAATYADLLPPRFYEQRLLAHQRRDWRQLVEAQRRDGGGVLVARDASGILTGFCQYGVTEDDDDDPADVGQIHRLYVLPGYQRRNVGRTLIAHALTAIRTLAMNSATLWVLETDPRAIRFYEATGWIADGARRFDGAADVRYRHQLA